MPGYYECNGETFNPDQFKAFNDAFGKRNERRAALGLMEQFMFCIFSSEPFEPKPVSIPEPNPEEPPLAITEDITEDISALAETEQTESETMESIVLGKGYS